MLQSLKELGLLSARYAEEEALRAKQRMVLASTVNSSSVPSSVPSSSQQQPQDNSSTIVALVPTTTTQKVMKVGSCSSTLSSSSSLPGSPVIVQSPASPNTTTESSSTTVATNVIPVLTTQPTASFPSLDKFQPQLGLSLVSVAPGTYAPFTAAAPQGLLMTTPMGFTTMPALAPTIPATVVTSQQYQHPAVQYSPAAPSMEVFSSISSSRMRKPFHKRRPAHMDKNMLFCHFCGRKETPEWRKGPSGPATLCNACGLQWAKKMRAQRSSSSSSSSTKNSAKLNKASESKPSETENTKIDN